VDETLALVDQSGTRKATGFDQAMALPAWLNQQIGRGAGYLQHSEPRDVIGLLLNAEHSRHYGTKRHFVETM
jgi:hypothetical protein